MKALRAIGDTGVSCFSIDIFALRATNKPPDGYPSSLGTGIRPPGCP
ncbi:MAG: hypothetical protein LBN98_02530 [Prevotellaceae bacterium]|nr:hypothetical protein [Prevotellaceae bacterium]